MRLDEFNYYINKAVNQYINKVYNLYEINQQKSDDLRVLKASAVLTPSLQTIYPEQSAGVGNPLFKTTYEVDLPDDYLHILNCVVEYTVASRFKCYDAGTQVHFGAKRLTSDMFSQIINNYYMRPSYKNPYFYINNVTTVPTYPTESTSESDSVVYPTNENIERVEENRYGNRSKVRMELRYGKDNSTFTLSRVYIDYLKTPQFIRLTQEQVDDTIDQSQILEFPDYVCQEITNELVRLLLENASDPRLQSHIPVNQSIANPSQEQPKK